MSIAGKLLGVWAVGKTVSSTTPLFMRLLLGMVAITVFAVFTAVLIALLMVGGLWLIYSYLIGQGVDPQMAALIISGVLLSFLATVVMLLQNYWRRVRRITKQIIYAQSPISGKFHHLADAFMHGYMSPEHVR